MQEIDPTTFMTSTALVEVSILFMMIVSRPGLIHHADRCLHTAKMTRDRVVSDVSAEVQARKAA